MKVRPLPLLTLVALLCSPLGCDDSNKPDPAAEAAEAKAKEEEELQKRLAARKAEREAKVKAEEEEEKKKVEAIAAVAKVPDDLPKKLDKACEQVWEAQVGFMERLYADQPEAIEKFKGASATQKPMTVTTCIKAGSIETAACQAEGLKNAGPELKKELPAILRYCIEQHGKARGAAAVPPK